MNAEALDAVAKQVERGELDAAARGLLSLWREEPRAELAEALERFPSRLLETWPEKATKRMERWLTAWREGDPLAVPALLIQLDAMLKSELPKFTTGCFDAISSSEPDPRAGRACMRWLGDARHVRAPNRALYLSLEKAIKRHADPRDVAAFEQRAAHGTSWSRMIGAMSNLSAAYRPLHEQLRQRLASLPELERTASLRLRALGLAASQQPLPKPLARAPAEVSAMLARVRAAPLDEAHRGVFRDQLLEQGDPWGELIVLQETRAKTSGKVTARERSLLKQLRPRLLGTLASEKASVFGGCEFERGFLTAATVKVKGVTRAAAMMSLPELATLKRVSFVRDAALPPTLLALEEAHGVRFETLAAARKKRPTLAPKAVTMVDVTPGELAQERWWPELRELYVLGFDCPLSELVKLPVARQLTALGLRDMLASVAADYFEMDCVKALPPSVERVVFEVYTGNTGLKVVLLRAGKRWRTELRPSKPLRPPSGYFGGDLAELIRPLRHHLADAAAVEVMSGVPEAFRELAR